MATKMTRTTRNTANTLNAAPASSKITSYPREIPSIPGTASSTVPHRAYSSMDQMLDAQFAIDKEIAQRSSEITKAPKSKKPPYTRQDLRDIEAHSKSPQEVAAEIDAEEAAEKAEQPVNNHNISEVTVFSDSIHPEFGNLRGLTIDGEPWFVGKDVAVALGYKNTADAILKHVDMDDKNTIAICDGNKKGNPNMMIINESGLYSLILSSKLPSAKDFKHWVTSEVLPTIRKTGGYVKTGQEDLFLDTYMPFLEEPYRNFFKLQLQAMDQLNNKIRQQNTELKEYEATVTTLTADVPLATKRAVLNRLLRYPGTNFGLRYTVLYKEFDSIYHINTKLRMEKYNMTHSPKCTSRLQFIDEQLGMIEELYALAAKLYKSDLEALVQQLYDARAIEY